MAANKKWCATILYMSVDIVSLVVGAAIPGLGFLLTIAVTWGRFSQIVKDLVTATREMNEAVTSIANRTTALEVEVRQHSETLDSLHKPFVRRIRD